VAEPVQGDGAAGEDRGQGREERIADQDAGRLAEVPPERRPDPNACTLPAPLVPFW